MKQIFAVFTAVLVLTAGAVYAQHEGMKGHDGMSMKAQGMIHNDMSGMGKMMFKGEKQGVKVKVYVNDMESAMKAMMKEKNVKVDMSKVDPNLTHHVSSMIDGQVKSVFLKLTMNKESKEYPLMFMQGHYGSDVSMKHKGTYKAILTVQTEKDGLKKFKFDLKN